MPGELAPSIGGNGAAGRPSSGALGSLPTGLAATPACAGRNSGPFWPQAASADAERQHARDQDCAARRAAARR